MSVPRIFLSYCSEDREKVSKIREAIEGAGLKTWRDLEDLAPGDNLVKIKQAIEESYAFVFLLSAAHETRENWSLREVRWALERHEKIPGDKTFVIPARLENVDMPLLGLSGPQLQNLVWVDLFNDDEYEENLDRLIGALRSMAPDSQSAQLSSSPEVVETGDAVAASTDEDEERASELSAGERKSFTNFVIIAGRHPAALLAGDDDLDTVQACIKRAENSHGQDWLFWLGEQAPADIRKGGSGKGENGIRLEDAKPEEAVGVASAIRDALAEDRRAIDLKIVVTAPLMYWRGEWWAIGSVGDGAGAEALEGDDKPVDSYFYHLMTLLDRLVPEPEDEMPATEVHFHRYRFWGKTGPERMPFDLPDEEDLAAFKKAGKKFHAIEFLSESVGNWTPTGAFELPAVEESSGDSRDRQEVLSGKKKPDSRRSGGVCLVGRRGDRESGWMRKLKKVLEQRGVLKVFEVVQRPRRKPYEEPAVVAILRSELLDVRWIREWITGLPKEVPVWSFDPDNDDLAEWRFEGGLGEASLLEQAAALQAVVTRDRESQALRRWDLKYAAVELTQALYPGRPPNVDPIAQRIWARLREKVDPDRRPSESPDEKEVHVFVRQGLLAGARTLAEQVLEAYAEADELFFVEGRGIELRRAPERFLNYLGMFAENPPERPEVDVEPALWLAGLDAASEDRLARSWILKHSIVLDAERPERWPMHARRADGLLAVVALDWPPLTAKLASAIDLAEKQDWPVAVWGLPAEASSGFEIGGDLADRLFAIWRSGLERLEGDPGIAFGRGDVLTSESDASPRLDPTDREHVLAALAMHRDDASRWLADAVATLSGLYDDTSVISRMLLLGGIGRRQLNDADEVIEMWERHLELLGPIGCRRVVEQAAKDAKGHSARDLDELLERWDEVWAPKP